MKRREFVKLGFGAAAMAAIPGGAAFSSPDSAEGELTSGGLATHQAPAPRRCELLDFDWRFKALPPQTLKGAMPVDGWVWTHETAGPGADGISKRTMDISGPDWKSRSSEEPQINYLGHSWFTTTLPDLPGPGRVISFSQVNDSGEFYLNGKRLDSQEGYATPFVIDLDPAWNPGGPNVLSVRLRNDDGRGGMHGEINVGIVPVTERFPPDCDDTSWRQVQLPHDYIVEGEYDPQADLSHGSLPIHAAWYHRQFFLDSEDHDKCVWLYFEGVFRNAKIYVNGRLVGRQPDGYLSFHVDIAEAVHFGAENRLAVYVNPVNFEGWWYEGGGIYRHVWLNVADKTHVVPWGVYITSEVTEVTGSPAAKLNVETTVANRLAEARDCTVISTVLDPNGRVAGTATDTLTVPPGPIPDDVRAAALAACEIERPSGLQRGTRLVQEIKLASARLWSLEERNRYTLVTEVIREGRTVDRHTQRFGIRTLRFDPDNGFFLNEQPVKLNGVCNHQDFAGTGIGLPDSILYYRLKKLKEFGCNAIRCSHNPMAPAMYEACDELGLLVMDENRHPGSTIETKAWKGQPYYNTWHVQSMVLRDRNHPSVIMWSMWNEEWGIQNTPFAREMMATLVRAVHQHDRTRPVTCANDTGAGNGSWKGGEAESEDLLGVNYNYADFDILHQEFPNKMLFGSEIACVCECRGIYHTDKAAGHQTSYTAPDGAWEPLGSRKFVAGGFCWTAFDYRGEPAPFKWPEVNANSGFLDLCGFPKDAAFYWKAWWLRSEPMVHIFPHWNWPGEAVQNVPVWCFSNCDEVELFLNGKSLGRQTMPEFRYLKWEPVTYEAGRLEAKGYLKGQLAASKIVETTGAPAAIKLTPDRAQMVADGQDTVPITVSILDAQGRVAPTASNKVTFEISGAGRNAGVGNGDPSSHEPSQAVFRSAFAGYCMVLAQAGRTAGTIRVTATAEGLAAASVDLRVG